VGRGSSLRLAAECFGMTECSTLVQVGSEGGGDDFGTGGPLCSATMLAWALVCFLLLLLQLRLWVRHMHLHMCLCLRLALHISRYRYPRILLN